MSASGLQARCALLLQRVGICPESGPGTRPHPRSTFSLKKSAAQPHGLLGDLMGQLPAASTSPAPVRRERSRDTGAALRAAASATSTSDRQAFLDEAVRLNMGVARAVAHRYRNRGVPDDDLEQVAYLALVRAARHFDVDHESDFLSYAVPTIRGEVKKYFRDHAWVVRPPRRIQDLQGRITAARDELVQSLGRSPRPSEIAEHLAEDVHDVVEALATEGCFHPTSLDSPVGTEEGSTTSLGDLIGDDYLGHEAAEARAMLSRVIHRLSERDRRIIELRYFEQFTQQEIAHDIGVTQMHVSRLLSKIHGNLRESLTS